MTAMSLKGWVLDRVGTPELVRRHTILLARPYVGAEWMLLMCLSSRKSRGPQVASGTCSIDWGADRLAVVFEQCGYGDSQRR